MSPKSLRLRLQVLSPEGIYESDGPRSMGAGPIFAFGGTAHFWHHHPVLHSLSDKLAEQDWH